MADKKYDIDDNCGYDPDIRKLENSDPGNAETVFNPLFQKVISNIHNLKKRKADLDPATGKVEPSQLPPAQEIQDATQTQKGIATLGAPGGAARHGQKGDVGLGSVDNTSDADKPVSSPQLAMFVPLTRKINGQALMSDIRNC